MKSNYGPIIPTATAERPSYNSSDDETAAEMNRKRLRSSLSPIFSTRFPSDSTYYDEIPDFTVRDEQKLSVDQKEDIHKVMLLDMYSWTTFVHMISLDQEILWLVEMSKIVASKHPFHFIKKHMSWGLKAFVESGKIESVSQLIRLYSHTTNMSTTSEFVLKRPFARRKIIQLYCRQVDFEANFLTNSSFTKRRKMEIEVLSKNNYLLHNRCNMIHKVNDTCYLVMIDTDATTNIKYNKVPCRILGYKRVESDTLYYNVQLDIHKTKNLQIDANTKASPKKFTKAKNGKSHDEENVGYISIERVHPQSLFTLEQYDQLVDNAC
jgi:hypothetical protein